MNQWSRREFLQAGAAASVAAGAVQALALPAVGAEAPRKATDKIQLALIGAGRQGQADAQAALATAGVELVAVADCYDGRLERARELWGKGLFTTRDYRELLARRDVDAVIVATPDHWHRQAAIEAMRAGKDVYCEKPMIFHDSDGPEMIAAARATGRILQVGSQRVSSAIWAKAKSLLETGMIGKLNSVSASWNRNSYLGAWNYPVPTDASPESCDWERFQGSAARVPFSGERFFQWRKWRAYSNGLAGDLFVHLFSGVHFMTGSKGPTRGMATGGLRFWKDGRDIDDVMMGLFDYPEGFNLNLSVNFAAGSGDSQSTVFTGSEGSLEVMTTGVVLTRAPQAKEPGLSVGNFSLAEQTRFIAAYRKKYPEPAALPMSEAKVERWMAPAGYDDTVDHFRNFFDAVRTRRQPVEDAVFGYRAAGAALLSMQSIDCGEVVRWDPEAMRLLK